LKIRSNVPNEKVGDFMKPLEAIPEDYRKLCNLIEGVRLPEGRDIDDLLNVIMKHNDGRVTVVRVHRGEEIGRGLLSKIIKDAELTREEFLKLLKEI